MKEKFDRFSLPDESGPRRVVLSIRARPDPSKPLTDPEIEERLRAIEAATAQCYVNNEDMAFRLQRLATEILGSAVARGSGRPPERRFSGHDHSPSVPMSINAAACMLPSLSFRSAVGSRPGVDDDVEEQESVIDEEASADLEIEPMEDGAVEGDLLISDSVVNEIESIVNKSR